MIELTQQQQQAVDALPLPRFLDPRTKKSYVLVAAEIYDRIREQLGENEDVNMRLVARMVENAMRDDDMNDPTLDFYQQKFGK